MKHLLTGIYLLFNCYLFGQQSVNSSGGDIQSAQGSVAFSVGQIATNYIESGNSINEGVQQPYEFFEVLSITKPDNLTFLEIFPNPTNGIIYLNSQEIFNATVEIVDENGRLVFNEKRSNVQQSQIDLTPFTRGIYTVKINGDTSSQIIRIIKN